jgi:hypothetical protein
LAEDASRERHLLRVLGRVSVEDLVAQGIAEEQAAALLEQSRSGVRGRFDWLRQYEDETEERLTRRTQQVDEAFNPYWGSSFAERHNTSRFGVQVEDYACVYTSRVSNFRYLSPSQYLRSPHGFLPHWVRG